MTSKACFSNRTGFFRQLTAKQLWLFALWSVFLLFLYPLSGMMEYSSITARADLMNLQFSVDRSFLSRTYVVLFMMPVLAIVFSSCFGYLNSRQKLDFYHSQPVTRVRLFFTNYLSGLFHFLIPYLVMHTLAFVLMNSITGFYKTDLRLLVWPLLYTLAAFLIFYSLVILFRVVCGNTVIAVLSYAFITNLPAIGYFLYQIYIGRWSKLYMGSATLENCLWLSPYTLLTLPEETTQYNVVPDSFGYSYSFAVDWISLLVWALIAVLAVAGGVLLYKSRPSEKAGSAVAVRGALPVIKYPLVVTASLLGGIFFTAATNGSLVWEIIGYVLFGLLALMLVNVLEKFDFKNVLHGLWKVIPCLAAVGLFVGAGALGAWQNDEIPAAGSVERIYFKQLVLQTDETYQITNANSDVFVMDDPEAVRTVVEILGRYDFHKENDMQYGNGYCRMDVQLDMGMFSGYKRIVFQPTEEEMDTLIALLTEQGAVKRVAAYDFLAASQLEIYCNILGETIFYEPPYDAELLAALSDSYRNSWYTAADDYVQISVYTDDGWVFSCGSDSTLYRWLAENGYIPG